MVLATVFERRELKRARRQLLANQRIGANVRVAIGPRTDMRGWADRCLSDWDRAARGQEFTDPPYRYPGTYVSPRVISCTLELVPDCG